MLAIEGANRRPGSHTDAPLVGIPGSAAAHPGHKPLDGRMRSRIPGDASAVVATGDALWAGEPAVAGDRGVNGAAFGMTGAPALRHWHGQSG